MKSKKKQLANEEWRLMIFLLLAGKALKVRKSNLINGK